MAGFKLTYGNMFNPPEEMHKGFDKAVAKLKANLGKEYGMIIDGKDVFADDRYEDRSPVNTDWVLAVIQKGNATQANLALEAARKAFPAWSHTPWQKRVQLVRKAASIIEKRIFELGAAMALEVGKNRMESLGDVQETIDLMYYSATMMEKNDGFVKQMGKDPLVGFDSTNVSVLRPYGVDGRTCRRGSDCWEYGRHQAGNGHCLDRPALRRMFSRRRLPGGCGQ